MGIAVVLALSLLLGVTDAAPKPEEAGVHSTITLNTDDNKKVYITKPVKETK